MLDKVHCDKVSQHYGFQVAVDFKRWESFTYDCNPLQVSALSKGHTIPFIKWKQLKYNDFMEKWLLLLWGNDWFYYVVILL